MLNGFQKGCLFFLFDIKGIICYVYIAKYLLSFSRRHFSDVALKCV